jgi:hypothetical protein
MGGKDTGRAAISELGAGWSSMTLWDEDTDQLALGESASQLNAARQGRWEPNR